MVGGDTIHHLVVIQLYAVQVALGSIGSCGGHPLLCRLSPDAAAAVIAYSLSISFHIVRFFATLIHVSLFFISLPSASSVYSGLRKAFNSSSHLLFGVPTGLYVWCLMLGPEFHCAASGSGAFLIAKRHFILLCVSIQHGILAAFILSTAVSLLLFTYSIHSSSSISAVSVSSSVSFMKETSLSWSQSVLEMLPSAASSSELLWFSFSPPSSFSFLLV